MAQFTPGELVPLLGRLGFDEQAFPPWVMVPTGGRKIVSLVSGVGLTVQVAPSVDPTGAGVVSVQEEAGVTSRRFVLVAKGAGTAIVKAVGTNGQTLASLEVTVKDKKSLSTCFHLVFESRGRSSSVSQAQFDNMIDVCNKLYLPQANIELVHTVSLSFRVPFNMDRGFPVDQPNFQAPASFFRNIPGPLPCISSRPPGLDGCLPEDSQGALKTPQDFIALRKFQMVSNVVSHVHPQADYNIFFVRAFDQGNAAFITGAFTPSTLAGASINACFIPNFSLRGQVLAHELGHFLLTPKPSFLNAGGHSSGRNDLMQERPGPDDIKIPKEQSNVMNRSGRQ